MIIESLDYENIGHKPPNEYLPLEKWAFMKLLPKLQKQREDLGYFPAGWDLEVWMKKNSFNFNNLIKRFESDIFQIFKDRIAFSKKEDFEGVCEYLISFSLRESYNFDKYIRLIKKRIFILCISIIIEEENYDN